MKQLPIVFSLFGGHSFAEAIHQALGYEIGDITVHLFPDEETVVTIDSSVEDRDVLFIAQLDRPNSKLLPLLLAVETANLLGAKKIGLIAPYLPYMRQDKAFHPGEGITSQYFATLISGYFDGLITIDPHLHRWHSLRDIYTIPAKALHATDCIASWISHTIPKPVLIGPDAESAQWVSVIAEKIAAPFLILEKLRKGDHQVQTTMPEVALVQDHTPILVDDIISTAATMIETVRHLKSLNMKAPVCIGVHAIFAGTAYEDLVQAGVGRIVTCNTIRHPSNGIELDALVVQSIDGLFSD